MGLAAGAMLLLAERCRGRLPSRAERRRRRRDGESRLAGGHISGRGGRTLAGVQPGLLTLRIPGASPAAASSSTHRARAPALQQLVVKVTAAADAVTLGSAPAGSPRLV